jgi:hypothetical protein
MGVYLRVPCRDAASAARFRDALTAAQVDVDRVEGRFVVVPTGGHPAFAYDLAVMAVEGGHADDADIAPWAAAQDHTLRNIR